MNLFIVSGSNQPETTHVVMGELLKLNGETSFINIDVNAIQDPVKKAVYDAFFNLVGSYVSVQIINSPQYGDFNHVTPIAVEKEAEVIDYNLLSQTDKDIIDNALALLDAIEEI